MAVGEMICYGYGYLKRGSVLSVTRKLPNKRVGTAITLFGEFMGATMGQQTAFYYIPIVISKFIAKDYMLRNRVLPRAFERLERCARKLARTVLRGGDGSNAVSLPDKVTVWE